MDVNEIGARDMMSVDPQRHESKRSPYAGHRAVIVTKHGKERAILPVLRERLGMFGELLILDTDQFGTFTGEIPRTGDQLGALRAKTAAAAEATPYDAVFIASEGAFLPDPGFPWTSIDRELISLFDRDNDIEVVGCAVSKETNMVSQTVATERDVEKALCAIRFPSHAAVLREGLRLEKGVTDAARLWDFVRDCWTRGELPTLESDMRAHCNPTRMAVIAAAAQNLADRLLSPCPCCARPGYWITQAIPGLPCVECGSASSRTKAFLWSCTGCAFAQERSCEGYAKQDECSECNP